MSRPQRKTATFRFYAELNDFLEPRQRGRDLRYRFTGRPKVEEALEAFGVRQCEVEVIVVEGRSVGFGHRLDDGDRVAVYPMFEAVDVSPILRLREQPLRQTRFILGRHLGELARLLRRHGFDVRHREDFDDAEIVRLSLEERRIVLTHRQNLHRRRELTHAYRLRSEAPMEQLEEVISRFDLRRDLGD